MSGFFGVQGQCFIGWSITYLRFATRLHQYSSTEVKACIVDRKLSPSSEFPILSDNLFRVLSYYHFTLSLTSLHRELSESSSACTSQTEFDRVGLIGTSSHYSQVLVGSKCQQEYHS